MLSRKVDECEALTQGTRGVPKLAACAKTFMEAAAEQGQVDAIEALKLLDACAACGAPDATRTCQAGWCKLNVFESHVESAES